MWGDGYERVKVIGRHRGSKRFVMVIINSKHLTDWRVKKIFDPYIVKKIKTHWDSSDRSHERAEQWASIMNEREKS